ncbi:Fibronectin type III domain-containing protein [Melioribacter roseus P3M-2]|uniref:Fibronectin type III domain-containing protein n=1 Tax=Melioribacter roseus (strain DSM 23840 / JCM 17771 / VKM B-2668 / P3M-2) TaxID=1191523 RepID=I6ZVQ3_MELRP|nr:fibronectin type III domain-containing protein [Melioribacter roseus]AFN76079.1 Fibronectin type III domain-containing protein [Melioribacter roseus P3M-2]
MIIFILLNISCRKNDLIEPADDYVPPLPPIKLEVYSAFDGQVGLSWRKNMEPDIEGYLVYRSINDTSDFTYITFTINNYYIDGNLEYDSTYYYRIAAKDFDGNISGFSDMVSAKPVNIFPPYNPVYLYVYARNNSGNPEIEVSWSPAYDNDISHYEIYRSAVVNYTLQDQYLLLKSADNYFLDTNNIELLKKYYYRIVSVDKGGLKSSGTEPVSDYALNVPELLYPGNNTTINKIDEFIFRAASAPASYELIIQTSEHEGVIHNVPIFDAEPDSVYALKADNLYLNPYIKYYWKIAAYTKDRKPNSVSKTFSFFYNPGQN